MSTGNFDLSLKSAHHLWLSKWDAIKSPCIEFSPRWL